MRAGVIARGLAWFGIALGLAELVAPRRLARVCGLQGCERVIRAFGVREIVSGVLVLRSADPQGLLWVRVAGDVLDGMLLGAGMTRPWPQRKRALLATAAVAPVVILDLFYARRPRDI